MAALTLFDVKECNSVSMVVVESDLLPPDASIVVIPLLSVYPAVQRLHPKLPLGDRRLVLAT